VYKKIKEFTGTDWKQKSYILVDKGGNVLDIKDQMTLWVKYIETLFNDQREEITNTQNEIGPSILKEEVQVAIKLAEDGKAPGPDDLPEDVLKLIEDNTVEFIRKFLEEILEENIANTEFGFRNGSGTRKALFAYNVLMSTKRSTPVF